MKLISVIGVLINFTKNYLNLILSFIFPLIVLSITSGIAILNPRYVDWLTIGDGQVEIAWEFFRNTPFFQFPIGTNYDYGMEISSSIIYNGVDPLFALFFKFLNIFLPDRFQYFGYLLYINLALVYYFSTKIISLFTKSLTLQILFGLVFLISPITLHRYIEYTHYTLTANWLILWAIYLILNKKYSVFIWLLVLSIAALTHPYYMVMIFPFFLTDLIQQSREVKSSIQKFIEFYFVLTTTLFILWAIGFEFSNNNLNNEEGFGRLRSNLLSLFNPYDWSNLFSNFPKPDDGNEGFAYIGLASILILIISIFIFLRHVNKDLFKSRDIVILLIPSILLFILSLSNKVAIGSVELVQIPLTESLNSILSTFRASGRFSWPLAYVVMTWSAFVFIKSKITIKIKSSLLIILLIMSFIDQIPEMTSEREYKFSAISNDRLTDSFWNIASNCYKNIVFYPPYPNVDNWYKYAEYAQSNKMKINSGLLSRFDYNIVNNSINSLQLNFRLNKLDDSNLYIFSSSEFFNNDNLSKEEKMVNYSLSDTTFVGMVDDKFTLAPNLANCDYYNDSISSLKPVIKLNEKFGPLELEFKSSTGGKEFLFENWSVPEPWGTWGLGTKSSVLIPISRKNQYKSMVITGKTFSARDESFDRLEVLVNGIAAKICSISTKDQSKCSIDLRPEFLEVNKDALYVEFILSEAISPLEASKGDDPRPLGLGLSAIEIRN